MFEHEQLIIEYSHERFRPREAEALKTLQKIASVVKPIMRQRNWKVGTLKEFYPDQTNLLGLNVNKGQSICLRLRYATDERQFLPFEDVVDTMLHELCHIVHGPHDQHFHKLWDQLRDEHESLLRKGYTGEGFLGKGQKLGGQGLPIDEARRRARAAAEQRRTLTAGSGRKLGGAPVSRSEDIRNVILNAIEKRSNITKGCATDSQQRDKIIAETSKNGFRTKAEEDDANERAIAQAYMELVQEEQKEKYGNGYIEPSSEHPLGSQQAASSSFSKEQSFQGSMLPPPVPEHNKPSPKTTSASSNVPPPSTSKTDTVDDSWTCEVCTFHNNADYLCCEMCTTERPSVPFSDATATPSSDVATRSNQANQPSTSSSSRPAPPRSSLHEESKLRSKRSKQNLKKYAEWSEVEKNKPLGWLCQRCGTFMESQWWTCASCGTLKSSS